MLIFKINFYVLDILVTYFRLSPGSQHITYRYMSLKKPVSTERSPTLRHNT
jgi:hypothetical protein